MRLTDLTQRKELEKRADCAVALAIASDSWLSNRADAMSTLAARGFSAYQKAAGEVLASTDPHVANQFGAAVLELVERESLAGRLTGAARAPLGVADRIQIARIVGSQTAEGQLKPVGTLQFGAPPPPTKTSATVVMSGEYFRSFNPDSMAAIRRQIVSAAVAAADDVIVGALVSAAPLGSSTPGALLAAIGSARFPTLIGGYDTLIPLAAALLPLDALGVAILASPSAAGKLIAVDAGAMFLAADEPRFEISRHADVVLTDGGSPGSEEIVHLFQQNLLAMRSEMFLQVAVAPAAVAWATA